MKLTKDRRRIDKDVDVRSWCRKSDVFTLENLSVFVSLERDAFLTVESTTSV